MTLVTGKQIYILPNISKSSRNHTMKFGQLIECNVRDIFLEIKYTKCGGKISTTPISAKIKWSISLDQ